MHDHRSGRGLRDTPSRTNLVQRGLLDPPLDLSWDHLESVYTHLPDAPPEMDGEPPASGGIRGIRDSLRALTPWLIAAVIPILGVCVAAVGEADIILVSMAMLCMLAWTWAAIHSWYRRYSLHLGYERSTATFLMEINQRLRQDGVLARRFSTVFCLMGATAALGGTVIFASHYEELSASIAISVMQWMVFAGLSGLTFFLARARYRAIDIEFALHQTILEEFEIDDSAPTDTPLSHEQNHVALLACAVVVGLVGATLSWVLPQDLSERVFGRHDSAIRILIVSDTKHAYQPRLKSLGFDTQQVTSSELSKLVHQELGRFSGFDSDRVAGAMAVADHLGFGFLLIERSSGFYPEADHPGVYATAESTSADLFAAISIGDVFTSEGHDESRRQLNFGGPDDLDGDPHLAGQLGLMRALVGHPVLARIHNGEVLDIPFDDAHVLRRACRKSDYIERRLASGNHHGASLTHPR